MERVDHDIRVDNENLDELVTAREMVRKNHKNINILFADGLHENKAMFNLCEK
ncbi:MAG: hypothetical protein AABW75_01760 [Nanoarchaeota archaeon]